MRVAIIVPPVLLHHHHSSVTDQRRRIIRTTQYRISINNEIPNINCSKSSMSEGFHQQGIFNNGFQRSTTTVVRQEDQHHIAQQNRRDKLRSQGFEPPPPLVAIEEEESGGGGGGGGGLSVYDTSGMWSDMFNFPPGGGATPTDVLENQIPSNYHRLIRQQPPPPSEWYGNRNGLLVGGSESAAAAMQLFLMNPPQQPRSPSSPSTSSHHHPHHPLQGFHSAGSGYSGNHRTIAPAQFTWVPGSGGGGGGGGGDNAAVSQLGSSISKIGESQGLSLSLSSSLRQFEVAKAEELRMGDDGVFFYDHGGGGSSGGAASSASYLQPLKNLAAQELLEEFCSVGRVGQFKKNTRLGKHNPQSTTHDPNYQGSGGGGGEEEG
ncbi:hypothetical protein BVC80_1715g94 [Macleaya cordata]|uniref:POX domain-containing protein n=1 Tax=Macleaya cordata TaxID=56857 RepID=A0A200Q283_MACCD|nr:hypothetical protein BVC80_1715g94 [Macleaya cordata]